MIFPQPVPHQGQEAEVKLLDAHENNEGAVEGGTEAIEPPTSPVLAIPAKWKAARCEFRGFLEPPNPEGHAVGWHH